jgi:hypothetical protein
MIVIGISSIPLTIIPLTLRFRESFEDPKSRLGAVNPPLTPPKRGTILRARSALLPSAEGPGVGRFLGETAQNFDRAWGPENRSDNRMGTNEFERKY